MCREIISVCVQNTYTKSLVNIGFMRALFIQNVYVLKRCT